MRVTTTYLLWSFLGNGTMYHVIAETLNEAREKVEKLGLFGGEFKEVTEIMEQITDVKKEAV